jgi:hypothetical protein
MGKRLRWMVSVATGAFILGGALHAHAQRPTAISQVTFDASRCSVDGGLTDACAARGVAVIRVQQLLGDAIGSDRGQSQ